MSESKLREHSMEFSVDIIELVKHLKSVKESVISEEDEPAWGGVEERAISMEVATAAADLTGGADAVVLRHPASVATVKKFITELL